MEFEWDEAKNLENIRKHEIDFADIPEVLTSLKCLKGQCWLN